MAAIKYDVSDVEAGGGGEEPQPNMYAGNIVSMTHRNKKADKSSVSDLEIVVDIGKDYVRKWTYVKLPDDPSWDKDLHGWKLRELTDALGLPPKGSIDPIKVTKEKPAVNVRIKADTNGDGEYRGKIKNLFKPGKLEESSSNNGGSADGEGEDYSEWTIEDLEGEIQERGLEMPSGRKTLDKLKDVLLMDDSGGEVEPEAEAEPETEPETVDGEAVEAGEDYSEWTLEELKAEVEEKGLLGNMSGRKTKDKYIAVLEAAAAGPTGDGEATEDDYDEWPAEELLAEIKDRKEQGSDISIPRGPKSRDKDHLISALRADDQGEPF